MNPEQNSGQSGGQLPPQDPNQMQSGGQVQPPDQVQQPVQTSSPHAEGGSPYDFIMNPQKPAKKPLLLPTGNSMLQRVAIFGGAAVLAIILIAIVASVLGSGGKAKSTDMITVAQQQTELVRVATAATQYTTTLPMQNLAQDVQASITSDRAALLKYMKATGQKVSAKQLTLKQSAATDTTLATAKENSTYDSAFKDVIQADLSSYEAALQKAYNANPGPKGKALLSQQFNNADLLLKLSKQ